MSTPALHPVLSIQDWVQGLSEIPASQFTQENVQHYVLQHAVDPQSLKPYAFFTPQRYGRNLIFKNDVFECLALCWDIDQSSSIHNHNDRLGWIYLAEGRLFVQNYTVQNRDPLHHTCRLSPTDSCELGASHSAYVDKEQAVHKVSNLPRYQQRAVSVHVYQQPMSQCEIYSLEAGTYEVVQLSYTSELGRLNPGVKL